jgi:hypothetical protein
VDCLSFSVLIVTGDRACGVFQKCGYVGAGGPPCRKAPPFSTSANNQAPAEFKPSSRGGNRNKTSFYLCAPPLLWLDPACEEDPAELMPTPLAWDTDPAWGPEAQKPTGAGCTFAEAKPCVLTCRETLPRSRMVPRAIPKPAVSL